MPFLLTRTNLEDLKTDAKVIGSCPYRTGIYSSGWQPDLWAEQRRIRQMQVGEVMVTSGQEFDAKCGIIAMPPIWEGGARKETLHLAACYDSALRLAYKRRCRSVAFNLLSGDCNGFPRDLALQTAIDTIGEFLLKHEMLVYVSVKDAWAQHLPKPAIPELSAKDRQQRLSTQALFEQAIRGGGLPEPAGEAEQEPPKPPQSKASPFGFLKPRRPDHPGENPEDSFSLSILKIMEDRDLKDAQVCQTANLTWREFSRIRGNPNYQPSKQTAAALCLALKLSLPETEEMLQKAGYILSDRDTFDIILKYYISRENYRIYEINRVLFIYEQPLMGE